jgi:flagellar secretion chaperone FliS
MPMKAADLYKKAQVQTVDEGKLLLMLYDGALQFIREAEAGASEKNIEKCHNSIIKAQKIISELMISLNLEAGGEIAKNLQALYVFINKQLMLANIRKDEKMIREMREIVQGLRDAFCQIVRPQKAPVGQSVPAGELKLNLQG